MFNINMEYMKSYAKIASEALISMAIVWEQLEFENGDDPIEIFNDYYPFEKSFDEVASEFLFWVEEWKDKVLI